MKKFFQPKVTDEQVRELRERAASETDEQLAAAYGIARATVGRLRTGASRPEAGGPRIKRKCGLPVGRRLGPRKPKETPPVAVAETSGSHEVVTTHDR